MTSPKRYFVGEEIPDTTALVDAVSAPGHGAVITFLGIVRDHSGETRVTGLDYSAYPEMAESKLAEIGSDIETRFGPLSVAAAHRTGRLLVGEVSFALAIGAPHRKEALAAADHFIDRLKQIVPIWKQDLPLKEGV